MQLSPDGETLAVGGDTFVSIVDVETGTELAKLPHHTSVFTLLFLDKGRRLLTNDDTPRTRLWDLESYRCVGTLEAFDFDGHIIPSSDGLRLCCRWSGNNFILLDARPE